MSEDNKNSNKQIKLSSEEEGSIAYQSIIEKMPIPLVLSRGVTEVVELVNDHFTEFFGYTIDDIPDVSHWWLLAYPDPDYRREVREKWFISLEESFRKGTPLRFPVVQVRCKDGSDKQVEPQAFTIKDDLHIVAFLDFTEERAHRTELERNLRDKEALMKELNHRVKNNLALLSSLISLKEGAVLQNEVPQKKNAQRDGVGGSRPDKLSDLSDLKHQIDVIRIIHEKLFQSHSIDTIELAPYLGELLELIFSNFSIKPVPIDLNIKEISISTEQAVPLGLIVNELATNAIKHGFPETDEPRFSITLQEGPSSCELEMQVSNSGPPFPESISLSDPRTLGLQLVSTLVQQLRGSLELCRSPQPSFTIRFPFSPSK